MRKWGLVLMVCALAVASGMAQQKAMNSEPAKASAAFEKMKSLAGQWEGKTSGGRTAMVKYEVVSNGSAVMETLKPEGEPTMVTMYHLDGGRLMMTHYCSAGNQPRMKSAGLSADGKQLAFTFHDATNLSSADAGHMTGLTVTWKDANHFTQAWTWREKGKPDVTEVLELTRKL